MRPVAQPAAFSLALGVPSAIDSPRAFGAVATGLAALAGVLYALSPLSCALLVIVALQIRWASRDLRGRERAWVLALLICAVAIRVAVVCAIALTADPHRASFRSIYPDGQYALERSLWLRNALLGIPIAPLDTAEAFHEYGRSIYYYPLAWLQVVFGPAPYALHLTSLVWYFAAAIGLYRLVRTSFGSATAFVGLSLILCLPSLLLWSMAPLKESLYFWMSSLAVVATVRALRSRRWTHAATAAAVAALAVAVAAKLRTGGAAITLGGLGAGLALAATFLHRRLAVAMLIVAPAIAAVVLTRPAVQERVFHLIRKGAETHVGFVMTPGSNYRLLGFEFYNRSRAGYSLTKTEAIRYTAAAFRDFVLVPKPWAPNTTNDIAMVPQQLLWYAIVIFSIPGLFGGLRRDPLLTGLLFATALVGAAAIAPASGNVGTLIRHRDMVVPFLVWIGALGAIVTVNACAHFVRKEGK